MPVMVDTEVMKKAEEEWKENRGDGYDWEWVWHIGSR